MAEKKLNEEQMRAFVENEVRRALMEENINEGIDESALGDIFNGLLNSGRESGLVQFIMNYLKEHMNPEDILNFVIGAVGGPVLIKFLCNLLGINTDGVLAKVLMTAIGGIGGTMIGDAAQNGVFNKALPQANE